MHASSSELSGRTALITGANHGIGGATAQAIARRGASVLLTYMRIEPDPHPGIPDEYHDRRSQTADGVVEAILAAGGAARAVEADLRDPTVHGALFDEAEGTFGSVDVLVNNASGWIPDTFTVVDTDRLGRTVHRVSARTFEEQFAVDARGGALLIAEFALRHLRRGGAWGRIVSLTSGGSMGFPEEVSYGAAKAALENYTMSAALELAPHGITANVVYPPVTDTGWVTPQVEESVRNSPELLHIARPEDVAEVIAFLLSNAARFVTGNVIRMR